MSPFTCARFTEERDDCPKTRYQGEDGEASAIITPRSKEPDLIRTSRTGVTIWPQVVIPTGSSASTDG